MRPHATSPAVGFVLLVLAFAVGLLVLPGCGGRPETPEALFARLQELNAKKDVRGMWALYVPEGQEKQRQAIAGLKAMIRNNQDPQNMQNLVRNQFGVQTAEEFDRLSVVELIGREHEFRGLSKLMEGAEIVEVRADPEDMENHKDIRWRTFWGDVFSLTVKRVDGGWGMVQQSLVRTSSGAIETGQDRIKQAKRAEERGEVPKAPAPEDPK